MAFPQIGLDAVLRIQDFERNAAKYNQTIDQMEKKTSRMASAIGKTTQAAGRDMYGLTDEFRKGAAQFDQVAKNSESAGMKTVAALKSIGATATIVTAAIAGVGVAIKKSLEAGEAAAALEDMRNSFQNLAASSGVNAQKLIADLRSVSRGTVDTAALIRTANSALLAGGSQIADQLPRLYQIAEVSARATGKDIGYVFETLIRGIIKGSPLLIDNAEVYVKVGQAVDQYAASLGKTTDQMTTQERQIATLNAVLADGGNFIERAGNMAEYATDPFKQLDVNLKQFSDGLKTVTLPATNALTKSIEGLLMAVKYGISYFAGWKEVVANLGDVIKDPTIQAELFKKKFDETFQILTTGTAAIENAENAITDMGDAAEDSAAQVDELNKKRAEKLEKIALDNARRDEDIAIQRARQIEDADRNLARKREDMARDNAKAREKIEASNAARLIEVENNIAKQKLDATREAQRAREDLERSHREALFQINQKADDTISEAARRNDAVAIAAALRQKQRDLRDEQRNKQIEKATLERDLTEKQMRIDEDAALAMEKARQQNAEALAAQQEAEAQQEADLKLSLQRQEEDRKLSWERQNEDLVRARERALEDLDIWYQKELEKLKANLDAMTNIATTEIASAGAAIAQAATAAMQTVAGSSFGLTRDEQARQRGNFLGSETNAAPIYDADEAWRRRHEFFRAEGGMDIVNRPTRFVAGEAGPELAAFVPLRNNRLDIGGGLDVNVNGANTGGVDAAAVQQIVWAAALKLAQRISVAR